MSNVNDSNENDANESNDDRYAWKPDDVIVHPAGYVDPDLMDIP